jgi:hypothetical protein
MKSAVLLDLAHQRRTDWQIEFSTGTCAYDEDCIVREHVPTLTATIFGNFNLASGRYTYASDF